MCTSVSRCGVGGSNDFGESVRDVGRNRSHSRHGARSRSRTAAETAQGRLRAGQWRSGRRGTVARAEARRWTRTRSPVAAPSGLVAAMRSPGFDTAERRTASAAHDLHECSAGAPTRTFQVSVDRPRNAGDRSSPAALHVRSTRQRFPHRREARVAIEHRARTNYCDAFPAMAVIPLSSSSMAPGRRRVPPRGRAAADVERRRNLLRVVRPTSWRVAEHAGCAGRPTPLATPATRNATAHPPRC